MYVNPQAVGSAGVRRERCAVCAMPVFLAEKLVVARNTYHRMCFRCARCRNQLTPGNYYETEAGEFCCEVCPEEDAFAHEGVFIDAPLSDEEKSTLRKDHEDDARTRLLGEQMEELSVVDGITPELNDNVDIKVISGLKLVSSTQVAIN